MDKAFDWDTAVVDDGPTRAVPWDDDPVAPEPPAIAVTETRARIRRTPQLRRMRAGSVVVIMAALAGFLGGRLGNTGSVAPATPVTHAVTASLPSSASGVSVEALYKTLSPSIVQLVTASGGGQETGSGVIVDTTGIILTNNHVVPNDTVSVLLSDGTKLQGTISGRDPAGDLAVVKLSNAPDGLLAARLGDSSLVVPGQSVIAIGAPFGFQGSISEGIVSGVNRTFQGDNEYPPMRGLIQTDASINPGNSGGALFNLTGEVIGITTAIESPVRGSVGVGFAVPINQAQQAMPALVNGTTVQHPRLGITGTPATDGVTIVEVAPGSSAAAAGLKAGDVILIFDGMRVATIGDIANLIGAHKVGDTVSLRYRRGTTTKTINVKLQAS